MELKKQPSYPVESLIGRWVGPKDYIRCMGWMVQIGYILRRLLDLKQRRKASISQGQWFEPGGGAFQIRFVVNSTPFPWPARVGPEG